jgi:fatty acid desaturase
MPSDPPRPTDLRRYRRETDRRLLIAVLISLVVVGSVLIGLIYGWRSVFTALMCLLPGAFLVLLLWLFLNGIERLTADRDS